MANIGKFGALRAKFDGVADFVTVYIAEAHPAERKHFSGNFDISTHNNMEDRVKAANTLLEKARDSLGDCTILVDPMDDRANLAYAALPERLYIVQDGNITYEGGIGPFFYNIEEVEKVLSKLR